MEMSLGRQIALTHKAIHKRADERLAAHGSSITTWILLHIASEVSAPGLSQR